MAKSSLRISLTIHMTISQRITQVGEDSYLLELSELHKIRVGTVHGHTIGIFSTRFKGFETENMAKSSLRISLTIHMTLSQRITQVGEDSYLLELSELHKIGAHA